EKEMWPVAIVLMAVILFFWLAFMLTVWAWFQTIVCLFRLQFIRASLWFGVGTVMIFWWLDRDLEPAWRASTLFICVGATATLLRYLNRIIPPRTKPFTPPGFGPKSSGQR